MSGFADREPSLPDRFAQAMAQLGPFEPDPLLAVAVSGGADSLALALLANGWARARGGSVLALVVDHGLRAASHYEAEATVARLDRHAIRSRLLTVAGLARGPALAARARAARYHLLTEACAEAGCLHLLLGHHKVDQNETVMMRALSNSRSAGLAGMAALSEHASVRLLRPLLSEPPERLRAFLQTERLAWVEDPSNRDPSALRARLRTARSSGQALTDAATVAGRARAGAELLVADILADRVSLHPEGYALLSPGRIHPDALRALIQTITGAPFPPPPAAVERLAEAPAPATLGGVRILHAGRLGPGWLVVREAAAMSGPVAAVAGAVWDGRFQLAGVMMPNTKIGALGADMARFRTRAGLPAAVLNTLPAIRCGNTLVAVPHLGYAYRDIARTRAIFCPARPMAGAPFWPVGSEGWSGHPLE